MKFSTLLLCLVTGLGSISTSKAQTEAASHFQAAHFTLDRVLEPKKPQGQTTSFTKGAATSPETIVEEGFEGLFPQGDWAVLTNLGAAQANWGKTDFRANSGSSSAWSAATGSQQGPEGGPYADFMSTWMVYGPIDLSDANAATLGFSYWNDSEEEFDHLYWMASRNGTSFSGYGTSGDSEGWQDASFDLTDVPDLGNLTGETGIWIAFLFSSDSSQGAEGAYIDDILLQKSVPEPLPDLIAPSIAFASTTLEIGGETIIDVTIENVGSITAGAHKTQLFLSSDETLDAGDFELGQSLDIPTLAPGESVTQAVSVQMPVVPEGEYRGGVIVDIEGQVDEFDEANEFLSSSPLTLVEPGGIAIISTDPSFFALNLETGTSKVEELTIGNSGDVDLNWAITAIGLEAASATKTPRLASRVMRTRSTHHETVVSSLVEKTANGDQIPVIVGLAVPFAPEGGLTEHSARLQRSDIARSRASILSGLPASKTLAVKRFETIPFIALEADASMIEYLGHHPDVISIEVDEVFRLQLSESTALTGAQALWTEGYTGAGQTVAILDTGVDGSHPFLAGKVVAEACFSTTSASSETVCPDGSQEQTGPGSGVHCDVDSCNHGTHVAGIAAGSGESFSGVAPDADIIAIQVFSRFTSQEACDDAAPCALAFNSDIIAGLEYVYELRSTFNIAAANMSIGGDLYASACDDTFPAYQTAFANLISAGIAPVVASGNAGSSESISAPACISNAVSVGSTTKDDAVSTFSNGSAFLSLLAPGQGISSSIPGSGFGTFSGTSMAAPHVAGAWALLKSHSPSAPVEDLLSALKATGASIVDPRSGIVMPRIQIDQAVEYSTIPSWISIAQTSGSVPPGGVERVQVTIDALDLEPATYSGVLRLTSNDPNAANLEIPVDLTVGAFSNPAPTALDDAITTSEDVLVEIDVLANDLDDTALDPGSVVLVMSPEYGVAAVNPVTGFISYSPAKDYFGSDSFTYTANDEDGTVSNIAGVSVTVQPVNDAPFIVVNTGSSIHEGRRLQFDSAMLQAGDIDHGATELIYSIDQSPLHGDLQLSGAVMSAQDTFSQEDVDEGHVTYLHAGLSQESDQFDFTIRDAEGASVSASFVVAIQALTAPEPSSMTSTIEPGSNGALQVSLEWALAEGSSAYHLQVANAHFTTSAGSVVHEAILTTTTHVVPEHVLTPGSDMYWRVRSGTSEQGPWSDWSESSVITTSRAHEAELPAEFVLGQNYPNPFNPVSAIPFSLPASSHVRLTLYDALGREIRTLVDRTFSPGKHQVSLNAADLQSGVYLYRLQTASFSAARTLTILK